MLNRLAKVTKNGQVVAEYVYDESGLRVKKDGTESDIIMCLIRAEMFFMSRKIGSIWSMYMS